MDRTPGIAFPKTEHRDEAAWNLNALLCPSALSEQVCPCPAGLRFLVPSVTYKPALIAVTTQGAAILL